MNMSINPKGSNYKTATLKYALSSDKKIELIAKIIRGKNVNDALKILMYTPKKAASILHKVLKCAINNYTQNDDVKLENLYVEKVDVGPGPKLKRIKFVGRSRVHALNKYRTFVRIVLNSK